LKLGIRWRNKKSAIGGDDVFDKSDPLNVALEESVMAWDRW